MAGKLDNPQRLAIVIPAFNAADTIGETVQSICECRHVDKIASVYVCDDASTDRTAEIARKTCEGRIPLEIWRNDHNIGEQGTLNNAFRSLRDTFDWVYLIHADDIAKPNWIELYFQRIQNCDLNVASISSSWDTWFPDTGIVVHGEDDYKRDFQTIEGNRQTVSGTLARGCWWRNSGCVINLNRFFEVGEFKIDLPIVFDLEWALRCLRSGHSIEFIPRTSVLYRQHARSKSSESSRSARDLFELLSLYKVYYDDGYLPRAEWRVVRGKTLISAAKRLVRGLGRRDLLGIVGCLHVGALALCPSRINSH